MANRVDLTLLGHALTVRTEAPPDYVRRLAAYLEERVHSLQTSGVGDPARALMLAALEITDELFRAREEPALTPEVGARLTALVTLLERATTEDKGGGGGPRIT